MERSAEAGDQGLPSAGTDSGREGPGAPTEGENEMHATRDAGAEAPPMGNGASMDSGAAGDGASPNVRSDAALGRATDGSLMNASDTGTSASPPRPTGYAGTASDGLVTTSGGGSAKPDLATSCAQLKAWLEDATPRVVELAAGSTLDCRTSPSSVQACELKCSSGSSKVFWRIPVGDQTCSTLADFNGDGTLDVPAGMLVSKTRTDYPIRIKSNKTLRGAGVGATLLGVSLDIESQSNIIIQNVAIRQINPSLIEAGDGVTINGAHHVWIDHCAFSMISDGYADIRAGSRAITLSYNHIDGANSYVCDGQHNFISLVSDSSVTFDHNYFDHVGGRNPKVTGAAQVHLYSNYYEGVSYFCASAGDGSKLLVEGNYYSNSRYPHWGEGGAIEASGNQYTGTTSTAGRDQGADLPAPPYAYGLDPVGSLNTALPPRVGPHML